MDQTISPVLRALWGDDQRLLEHAQQQCAQAEANNYPMFLGAMCSAIANEQEHAESRRLAGLMIKNSLSAKDRELQGQKAQRWLRSVDDATRQQVKAVLLRVLSSPVKPARRAAAQAIEAIAAIELPQGMWLDLIMGLVQQATNTANDPVLRESSLETLGYICESIEPHILAMQSGTILSAVCAGMHQSETNEPVKYAATVAMYNSLAFVRSNFAKQAERDLIMEVVMNACVYPGSVRVRVFAYECLVKIVSLYYQYLEGYMDALFRLTFHSMEKDEQSVVKQAIEFWTSISDEELEMLENAEAGGPATLNIISRALAPLVAKLLDTLTRQEEDQDEDTWDVAMAGSTCLLNVAAVVGNPVVDLVMPYVRANIEGPTWHHREAATMAFACILEGPKPEYLAPLVDQGIGVLLQRLTDEHINVRDTAAWALGRLCEHQAVNIARHRYQPLFTALVTALRDEARVARHVCWALYSLAEYHEEEAEERTGLLSPFWSGTVQQLYATIDSDEADENNLRAAAYETLNMFIQAAPQDCLPLVERELPNMLMRLERTFTMQIISADDRAEQNQLQALICGCLQVMVVKLGERMHAQCDRLMGLLLQLFNSRHSSLLEEAFLTIGSVANATGENFLRYMDHLREPLRIGLTSVEFEQVCSVTVGVVGDIARALGPKMIPYARDILNYLMQDLRDNTLSKNVKPDIFSVFGDIALAIGGAFEEYLPFVVQTMQDAARVLVPSTPEMILFLNKLREGIFEGYTGIIQGLRSDMKGAAFQPYAKFMIDFCQHVAQDPSRRPEVVRAMVGALGDVAATLGPAVRDLVRQPWVATLIQECAAITGEDAAASQEVATYARQTIMAL